MKKQGFSLIEILIVLALIAVLASIAVPTYQKYTIKLHRTDGQTVLLDLANRMERYYAAQQTYANATIATGNTQTDLLENDESPKGWYQLKIAEQSPSSYLLHAVPLKQQAENDVLCQTLTLNHLGQKNITAGPAGQPSGDVEQCW